MNPLLVLFICLLGVAWMLSRDASERPGVSAAAWIVVAWAVLYASRPVTSWFVDPSASLSPESYDESSPGDALLNLALIVGAGIVLARRRLPWRRLFRENVWLVIVYVFWLQSILWSDYPDLTIKRLFKDLGNIAMVLVVLTDESATATMRAVCVRCACVCLPLSIVLIRYYPSVGRAFVGYNQDQMMFLGVTTHKNALGIVACVAVIFLFWDFLERRGIPLSGVERLTAGGRALVMLSGWYLLLAIDSVTALVCAVLGAGLLVVVGLPHLKHHPGRIELWGFGSLLTGWAVNNWFGFHKALIEGMGRDMSLTTRTNLWPFLLRLQDQPLLGAGFGTFWAGERLVKFQQTYGDVLVQAHNGYLDTYLNGGFVGVGVLVVLLGMSYRRIRRRLALGTPDAGIRFTMLLVAIVYNFTEATFFKLSLLWFVTVFVVMDYGAPTTAGAPDRREESRLLGRKT
jgi:exopolysaccharide production protein ExoQ